MTPNVITLADVSTGRSARIRKLHSHPDVCHRLREMGFCEDAVIRCMLNDEEILICEVCNSRIGLNFAVAKDILVTPHD